MHLHHYIDGICAGHGAKPSPCGEAQVYRPPVGHRAEYADVLVSKEDLRELIDHYNATCAMPNPAGDALADRLLAMLD